MAMRFDAPWKCDSTKTDSACRVRARLFDATRTTRAGRIKARLLHKDGIVAYLVFSLARDHNCKYAEIGFISNPAPQLSNPSSSACPEAWSFLHFPKNFIPVPGMWIVSIVNRPQPLSILVHLAASQNPPFILFFALT